MTRTTLQKIFYEIIAGFILFSAIVWILGILSLLILTIIALIKYIF